MTGRLSEKTAGIVGARSAADGTAMPAATLPIWLAGCHLTQYAMHRNNCRFSTVDRRPGFNK